MPYFILTTHQKGGVGKSTLTYNLAVNLKDKAKVCIVDMDVQGSLSDFKNFSPVPVLSPDKLPELKNSDIDFVFIDTPPYLSNKLPELCKLADAIINNQTSVIQKIKGIGKSKAAIILAAIELSKRINQEIKSIKNIKMNHPSILFDYYKNLLKM